MAKVYATSVPEPEFMDADGRFSHEGYEARCKQYREAVEAEIRSLGYNHKHTGKVISFPIADGYANYMVADGRTMVHLREVDAYSIPDAHARGVRINEEVERQEAFEALFRK